MSYEIHITRGDGFGQSGAAPINADEWTHLLEGNSSLVPTDDGAHVGTRPLSLRDGIISITSPTEHEFEALKAIAQSLGARLFGEDGSELGLSHKEEIVATVSTGFPDIDCSLLTDAIATHLITVSDPSLPVEQRAKALEVCRSLEGDVGVAGFAYLLCRAVECGGTPEPALTCAAAHLYELRPGLVDGFRVEPTQAWVVELEELTQLVKKKPGSYVVRRCHNCSSKNRVAVFGHEGQHPKCGRCKTFMAALE